MQSPRFPSNHRPRCAAAVALLLISAPPPATATAAEATASGRPQLQLVRHTIDTGIREADGQSLADIDGNGVNNPVVGTGSGGRVFWYERDPADPEPWRRHQIAGGFTEIEGTLAADFNGDGRIEVVIFDQATRNPPGLVAIARQDQDDPRGSWSTTLLDREANHVQQGLVFDITGDGRLDFFYAYEGRGPGDGGFYWLQNLGGDPLDADNWVKHEIDQVSGAWWIDPHGPRDFNDNGNPGDIAVTVREGRNRQHSSGAVLIYHRPEDPVNDRWEKTVIADLAGNDVLQICSGDFTGNGDARDLVVGVASHRGNAPVRHRGLHLYLHDGAAGAWTHVRLSSLHTAAVLGADLTGDGRQEIVAMDRTNHRLQLWRPDPSEQTGFRLEADHPFRKADDLLLVDDINGDGHARDLYVGSDPDGMFWFELVEVDDPPAAAEGPAADAP